MFLCFEGIAGSGKTTQANVLAEYIRSKKDADVFVSAAYEGKRRSLAAQFMNNTGIKSDTNAVMFLFQSLHAAQYAEVTKALKSGSVVIADRWRDSFFAHHIYQNTFGDDGSLIYALDKLAYRSLDPDITFLLDIQPQLAHARYIAREKRINDDGLELMDVNYFRSVTQYYKEVAHAKNWYVIDSSLGVSVISREIKKI